MNKEYMNVKDVQKITGLGYQSSMKIIDTVRDKMREKKYYIPNIKKKVALTWLIKRELGIK